MYSIIVMDTFVDALDKIPLENWNELKDSILRVNKLTLEEVSHSTTKENILNKIIKRRKQKCQAMETTM